MNNIKKNVLPVIVLCAICVVVAAVLGAVNMITGPIIEEAKNKEANAALLVVLPDGKNFKEITLTDAYPDEIKKAHKADNGYVFEIDTRGKEAMTIMCGVDNEGKIVKIKVLSEQETPGYKDKVFPYVTGDDGKYNGMDSSTLEAEIFTGATLTSNGVYNAVKAALDGFVVAGGGEISEPEYVAPVSQRNDDELISLAGELISDAAGFDFVDFDAEAYNALYLAKLMKETSGKGYVAYVFSISSYYGTVDTENLIHIGNDGTIKNIKKLVWAVSEANPDYGYNPPSDEKLGEFYAGLAGKDSETIGEVDLKTGATNTTTTLVASITEALTVTKDIIKNDMPTPEDEVKALAGELVGEELELTDVTPEDTKYLKRLYKDNSGKGYIAYVASISEYYGTVDTENIIHIGNDGKIKNIKKLVWAVSEAKPEWGYNPPSEEKLGEFYDGLNGKDSASLEEVDLQTGATNTTTVLVDSIKEALSAASELIKKDMPTPEEEVKALAGELVGAELDLTDVTPEDTKYLKRLYKDNSGKGYIAYVASISEYYGTVDTENIIHIGNDGKIKNIKKLVWAVSEAKPEWGYNPPSEEKLGEFYDGLNGKDSASLEEVDLQTGATNTTTVLVDSIKEALSAASELIKKDLPTPEEEVKALAGELVGAELELTDVTPADTKYLKRLYKDNGGNGYIAYVASISEYYGTVDTENIIHIGNDGAIKNIKKLVWAVSEAVPDWGYNPPSEEKLGQFYDGLVGKTFTTIEGIDLQTGATNTTTVLVDSIKEALTAAATIINGDEAAKELLNLKMQNLVPNAEGFEALQIPAGAPETVKGLYKVLGYDGYVVYTVTSTQYVAVETEALVYVHNGTVKNVELMTWTVGHGVEPGDFASTLIGKNASELCDVELVTEATGTAMHLRDAVIDAISVAPVDNTPAIVGAVALSLAVIAFAAYIIIPKIIRRRKNG